MRWAKSYSYQCGNIEIGEQGESKWDQHLMECNESRAREIRADLPALIQQCMTEESKKGYPLLKSMQKRINEKRVYSHPALLVNGKLITVRYFLF